MAVNYGSEQFFMCPMFVTECFHNKCLNCQPCVRFIFSPGCESDMILSVMTLTYMILYFYIKIQQCVFSILHQQWQIQMVPPVCVPPPSPLQTGVNSFIFTCVFAKKHRRCRLAPHNWWAPHHTSPQPEILNPPLIKVYNCALILQFTVYFLFELAACSVNLQISEFRQTRLSLSF